jgi:hypothetical protein
LGTGDVSDEQRVDLSLIGELAAGLMQGLEEDIAATLKPGEEAPTVEMVGIAVELQWPPSEENEQMGSTSIRFRCTDSRAWIQKAFFAEASDIADRGREPAG